MDNEKLPSQVHNADQLSFVIWVLGKHCQLST